VLHDLLERREAAFLLLREDQFAVDHDFELATLAGNEFCICAVRFLDLSRQTGGSGQVVSLHAVGEFDVRQQVLPVRVVVRVGHPIDTRRRSNAQGRTELRPVLRSSLRDWRDHRQIGMLRGP
jgi:hypothetical protein